MEMVDIIEYSNDTNCPTIVPSEESKEALSILSPTDESLSDFIHGEISDYLNERVDTTDHEHIRDSIRNLLITVIKANTNPQLTSDKSNDQKLEKE